MAPKLQSEFFDELFTTSSRKSSKLDFIPPCLREDPLLELLLQNPQACPASNVADSVPLSALIQRHLSGKTVSYPNRSTLGPEFTDDDYAKLCERILRQHQQFQDRLIKDVHGKVERFKQAFPHLTTEELFMALQELEFNEEDALLQLTKGEFVRELRQKIAKLSTSARETKRSNKAAPTMSDIEQVPTSELISAIEAGHKDSEREAFSDSEGSIAEDEGGEVEEAETDCCANDDFETEEDDQISATETTPSTSETLAAKPKPAKRSAPTKSSKKFQRLRLDEALSKADMEGWSSARIRAYQMINDNPNTYYYRFNAPGEAQRNGPWSPEEHELFMRRLAEHGADGQWGIFSMVIPGRVGYQCSNYYRKLIEARQISDPNYFIGSDGKAHYVGAKTRASATRCLSQESSTDDAAETDHDSDVSRPNTVETAKKLDLAVSSKRPRHRPQPKVAASQKVILYDYDAPNRPQHVSLQADQSGLYVNPLPGFIDAITRTEVVRPALSPYGHVLSYDTWIRCLLDSERKNTCPITKQPLHKRQLIILTHENIEMYRSGIIDLCNKGK